ncbi:MAG: hypothetical protein ACYC6X_02405 [Minisyncoccota bacterium]
MRHGQSYVGHNTEVRQIQTRGKDVHTEDFVLEKSIFNNIFEKDIRRVFIYKKAERLAKAIHLIEPAFAESVSLRTRIGTIAIGLVDAAILSPGAIRAALSRELLTLSSILSIASTSGFLSPMNADLIAHEAHNLLQEVATYEEPRLSFDEAPTLSTIAKNMSSREAPRHTSPTSHKRAAPYSPARNVIASVAKGHVPPKADSPPAEKDIETISDILKDRREAVLSVIRNKGSASIKDISTLIRGVSEKTIQRELLALIVAGMVLKQGERRWSTYSLV